jgi:hypothetical protein
MFLISIFSNTLHREAVLEAVFVKRFFKKYQIKDLIIYFCSCRRCLEDFNDRAKGRKYFLKTISIF